MATQLTLVDGDRELGTVQENNQLSSNGSSFLPIQKYHAAYTISSTGETVIIDIEVHGSTSADLIDRTGDYTITIDKA